MSLSQVLSCLLSISVICASRRVYNSVSFGLRSCLALSCHVLSCLVTAFQTKCLRPSSLVLSYRLFPGFWLVVSCHASFSLTTSIMTRICDNWKSYRPPHPNRVISMDLSSYASCDNHRGRVASRATRIYLQGTMMATTSQEHTRDKAIQEKKTQDKTKSNPMIHTKVVPTCGKDSLLLPPPQDMLCSVGLSVCRGQGWLGLG